MRFEIEPHVGVSPILFRMRRADVIREMAIIGGGSPVGRGEEIDCFFNNAFQVSYRDGTVEFVEVSNEVDHTFILAGVDVFDTPADQLLSHLSKLDLPDPVLTEGTSICFPT